MPICFYLYAGISKKRFLGIAHTVTAAEALCRESSLQEGEFIILRSKYNAYRYRFNNGQLVRTR